MYIFTYKTYLKEKKIKKLWFLCEKIDELYNRLQQV